MDILNFLLNMLGALANYGPVGKVLAVVIALAAALSVVASAVVAGWHSLVGVFTALSLVPGIGGPFGKLAEFFRVNEEKLDDFVNHKLLGVLSQISSIPLPKK